MMVMRSLGHGFCGGFSRISRNVLSARPSGCRMRILSDGTGCRALFPDGRAAECLRRMALGCGYRAGELAAALAAREATCGTCSRGIWARRRSAGCAASGWRRRGGCWARGCRRGRWRRRWVSRGQRVPQGVPENPRDHAGGIRAAAGVRVAHTKPRRNEGRFSPPSRHFIPHLPFSVL